MDRRSSGIGAIQTGDQPSARLGLARRLGRRLEGVLDDGLEHVDVLEEPAAAVVGDPAEGLRPVLVEALPDLDEAGLVEHLEVPAEVAVGEVAQLLEVGEDHARGGG